MVPEHLLQNYGIYPIISVVTGEALRRGLIPIKVCDVTTSHTL